jgi:hypothetical protein
MARISTFLIVPAVVLDILLAFSIPFLPILGLPIVTVNFINATAAALPLVDNSTTFSGQIISAGTSAQVQNLTELQASLPAFLLKYDQLD